MHHISTIQANLRALFHLTRNENPKTNIVLPTPPPLYTIWQHAYLRQQSTSLRSHKCYVTCSLLLHLGCQNPLLRRYMRYTQITGNMSTDTNQDPRRMLHCATGRQTRQVKARLNTNTSAWRLYKSRCFGLAAYQSSASRNTTREQKNKIKTYSRPTNWSPIPKGEPRPVCRAWLDLTMDNHNIYLGKSSSYKVRNIEWTSKTF
jgi:hypothetical protein